MITTTLYSRRDFCKYLGMAPLCASQATAFPLSKPAWHRDAIAHNVGISEETIKTREGEVDVVLFDEDGLSLTFEVKLSGNSNSSKQMSLIFSNNSPTNRKACCRLEGMWLNGIVVNRGIDTISPSKWLNSGSQTYLLGNDSGRAHNSLQGLLKGCLGYNSEVEMPIKRVDFLWALYVDKEDTVVTMGRSAYIADGYDPDEIPSLFPRKVADTESFGRPFSIYAAEVEDDLGALILLRNESEDPTLVTVPAEISNYTYLPSNPTSLPRGIRTEEVYGLGKSGTSSAKLSLLPLLWTDNEDVHLFFKSDPGLVVDYIIGKCSAECGPVQLAGGDSVIFRVSPNGGVEKYKRDRQIPPSTPVHLYMGLTKYLIPYAALNDGEAYGVRVIETFDVGELK